MSQGRPIGALLILVLALTGCAKDKNQDGNARWNSFPVPIYTDPALVATQSDESDFRDAMAFWEKTVGKKLFDYKGNWSGGAYNGNSISQNALFLQTPWSYSSTIAAQTVVISQKKEIQGAVIMVNPGTSFCTGDCTGQSGATSQRKVFAHELGHFLGLGHSTDQANIMYPDALPGGSLDKLTVNAAELLPLVN